MTRVLLIRHGTTDTAGVRLVGRLPGIALNAEGQRQAEELASKLARYPLAAIYSSPLERARATAGAIAAPHQLDVSVRERLIDIDFGEWTNRSLRELVDDPLFQRFNRSRSTTRPPGGEHTNDVQLRMTAELLQACERHPQALIAIVGHADPLRTLLTYLFGIPLDALWRIELSPASVSMLDIANGDALLRFLNYLPSSLPELLP